METEPSPPPSPSNRFAYFLASEEGQGINEYAAILAFIACLVVVVFSFSTGSLTPAVSQSFSNMTHQINRLNSYASGT